MVAIVAVAALVLGLVFWPSGDDDTDTDADDGNGTPPDDTPRDPA